MRLDAGVLGALAVLGFGQAEAASVTACGHLDRISFLAEGPRQFSNGKIRVALVDTDGEPVAGSFHVLVFIPDDPLGSRCFAVSRTAPKDKDSVALGFFAVAWPKLKATYDADKGLLVVLPVSIYDGAQGRPGGDLRIRIDLRGEGSVQLE
jgi:hypothetical protein